MSHDEERKDPRDRQDLTPPGTGGFGAFAQQYRDRWAASHPNAKRTRADDSASAPPPTAQADGTDAPPDTRPGP